MFESSVNRFSLQMKRRTIFQLIAYPVLILSIAVDAPRAQLYGPGVSDIVITGTDTLLGPSSFRNLTINSGAVLITNGFNVFVNETLIVHGTIRSGFLANSGTGGGGGSGGFGGGFMNDYTSATTGQPGNSGVAGAGGTGGDGGGGGGGGGGAFTINLISTASASGGNGGSGGAGGGGGRPLNIFARNIQNFGSINADGEDGSNGFGGSNGLINGFFCQSSFRDFAGGGGGGGGHGEGGGGGDVTIVYENLLDSGSIHSNGGAGGTGGTGGIGPDTQHSGCSSTEADGRLGGAAGGAGAGAGGNGGKAERDADKAEDGGSGGNGTAGALGSVTFSVSITCYADTDGDGFGDPSAPFDIVGSCPAGFVSDNTDCDDGDASIFPGATEICNGIDDNCDGNIDEGVLNTYYDDADSDGYGNPASSVQACSPPPEFVSDNTDCDDTDASINPGATEICNGIDDNCDGNIDEGVTTTYYTDTDGDGFGDPFAPAQFCSPPPAGFVLDSTDCNDGDPTINPGATEVCNGIDDNCDGNIDEGVLNTYCQDIDLDGFGDPLITIQACSPPPLFVSDCTDCNDFAIDVNPGAVEICNGIDDNCDGNIDEGVLNTYCQDLDLDGFGDPLTSIQACSPPPGFVSDCTDCDDLLFNVNPGVVEVCNGIDDNCDGNIDEGVTTTYYTDSDGDGFGDPFAPMQFCSPPPPGFVTDDTDCDDTDANINPGAAEVCNGIDDNCNGNIDEGVLNTYYDDADSDGFGNPASSVQACTPPNEFVSDNTDCDDGDFNVNPGVAEVCGNGKDDDCNGLTDEADPTCPVICCNLAGNANNIGTVNIADVTFLIARIFAGGAASPCCEEGDSNGDGSVNIADVTFLIARIFAGGAAPVCGPAEMGC